MDFATLERRAWTDPAVAGAYAERFPSMTVGSVPDLLDAARVAPGMRVLDIATGPGPAAQAAQRRGARPILFDLSMGMLAHASRAVPGAERIRGSALQIPLRDESLDATFSNFGLLHFPDPDRAFSEAARVLRPGATCAWSVWAEDSIALKLIPRTMERLGLRPALPAGPDFFQFGSPDRMATGLAHAGLRPRPAKVIAWAGTFASTSEYWAAFLDGTARTRASLKALPPTDLETLRLDVEGQLAPYLAADGTLSIPTGAVIGAGTKPA
jgi:SAM-dependent methyltransferase